MKAIHEPDKTTVEFVNLPRKGLVMKKTLARDLMQMAIDNKVKRVLVVLEK